MNELDILTPHNKINSGCITELNMGKSKYRKTSKNRTEYILFLWIIEFSVLK